MEKKLLHLKKIILLNFAGKTLRESRAKASKEINVKNIFNIFQSNFNNLLFRILTTEKLNAKSHTYIFNLWINCISEIAFLKNSKTSLSSNR